MEIEDEKLTELVKKLASDLESIEEDELNEEEHYDLVTQAPWTVGRPFNMKVEIYPNEEHRLPHFHVKGQYCNASFQIDNGEKIIGSCSQKYCRKFSKWAAENRDYLNSVWRKTRPKEVRFGISK